MDEFKVDLAPNLTLCLIFNSVSSKGKGFKFWNMSRLHNTTLQPYKIRCLKSKAKRMTYTFTTSHQAKREAQYSEGFHLSPYPYHPRVS